MIACAFLHENSDEIEDAARGHTEHDELPDPEDTGSVQAGTEKTHDLPNQ